MAKSFMLSPLPYAENALEPVISAKTIGFHYGKHHKAYVDTLNKLVEGTRYAEMKLQDVVRATANSRDEAEQHIFDNAAQVWNHDFYWRSLAAKEAKPTGTLKAAVERDFGGIAALTKLLAEAGAKQFGSGWAWLVSRDGKLGIEKTGNAENPMAKGTNCLLAVDVWEHSYYLDYQNERAKYLKAVLARLDWGFAAENFAKEDRIVRAAAE